MTEEEHKKIVKELEEKYLGKLSPNGEEIIDIHVDYRKTHQHMNRVEDLYGNIYFIDEMEGEE